MASHKYYGQRATSENWIEWCKNHMASGSILTQDFWANSAIFQTCIMAYNLMVWMMWLNDEAGFKERTKCNPDVANQCAGKIGYTQSQVASKIVKELSV